MRRMFGPMIALALAAAHPAAAQDLVETRFHRVHLRNGNFIDGHLVAQTDRGVTLRMKSGEITIRRDLVERVEYVKIRAFEEKHPEVEPPKAPARPPQEVRRDPFQKPAPPAGETTPPPPAPVQPSGPPGLAAKRAPSVSLEFTPKPEAKEAVDKILARLRSARPDQLYETMELLLRTGEGAAPYLASVLERMDTDLLMYGEMALSRMKDPASLPVLARMLSSRYPDVRSAVLEALGEIGDPSMIAEIRPYLKDPEKAPRRSAIGALQKLNDRDSFDSIARMLWDENGEVRSRAIGAVFQLARANGLEARVGPALQEGLERARGEARSDLIQAIGVSGLRELWEIVAPHLRDESRTVRRTAATVLGEMGVEEAGEAIVARMLEEKEVGVRVVLAVAAQKLKTLKAVDTLIDWLRDPDAGIRQTAATQLPRITGQNFGTEADKWAEWWQAAKPK